MCPFLKSVKAEPFAPSLRSAVRCEPPRIVPSPPPEPSSTAWPEHVRRRPGRDLARASYANARPPAGRQRPSPWSDNPDASAVAPASLRSLSVPASFAVRSTPASQRAKGTPWRPRAMWRPLRSPYGLPPLPPHRSPCSPPPPCSGGYDVPARFQAAALHKLTGRRTGAIMIRKHGGTGAVR